MIQTPPEEIVKIKSGQSWKKQHLEPNTKLNEQLHAYYKNRKQDWFITDFIKYENKIDLLWDELKIFLEDDEDFQILRISNDSIKIKATNLMAFRKEYVYCKILSNIIPTNCRLELSSSYHQADSPKDDLLLFDISITTESNLYYKGSIEIIK